MNNLHNTLLITLMLFAFSYAQQCTENTVRCTGTTTYQVCTGGAYGANQTCQSGLVCSSAGNTAYCVRPSEVTTAAASAPSTTGVRITTGAPCVENNVRCTGNRTYQVCTGGSYGANQTCQSGLVCSTSGNTAFCVLPSQVTTAASVGSTTMMRMTTGAAASTSGSTTGNNNLTGTACTPNGSQKCVSNNTYVTCTNGKYSVSQSCGGNLVCTASGNNIYCQNAPSSSGSASTSTSGTTMKPVTSGMMPATSGAAATTTTTGATACSPNGSQKCLSNSTYSTCTNGFFSQSQSCPNGLTCTPSGSNIYCVRRVSPGQPCSSNGYQSCITSETYSTCTNYIGSNAQSCAVGTTCHPSGNNIYCY